MTNQSETEDLKDLIVRKDGLTYKKYARVPFTGIVNRSGDSKTKTYSLDMRMHYVKGARTVGEWFHNNGQLKWRDNYKDGKLHGLYEYYYENGQLKIRGNYNNGKRNGPFEYFDEDGNLTKTETYEEGELIA